MLRAARVGLRASPIGRALDVYDAGYWIYDHWAYIEAYQDEPKTLDELRAAVADRKKGYDIHHIVERTPHTLNDADALILTNGLGRMLRNDPDHIDFLPT